MTTIGNGDSIVADCPACEQPFPTPRRASGRCRRCGKRFVIRRKKGQLFALTPLADRERTLAAAYTQSRTKIIVRLWKMRFRDEDMFVATERRLTDRFGARPDPVAVFWEIATWRAAAAISQDDWELAWRCLTQMALQAGTDRQPWINLSTLAYQAEMRWYSVWCPGDEVLSTGGCPCSKCAPDRDVWFTFDEAVREQRLPHAGEFSRS